MIMKKRQPRFRAVARFPNGIYRKIELNKLDSGARWVAWRDNKFVSISGLVSYQNNEYVFQFRKEEDQIWFLTNYKPRRNIYDIPYDIDSRIGMNVGEIQ